VKAGIYPEELSLSISKEITRLKIMQITIRAETQKDFADVARVNNLAFGQENEGILVEKLRKTDEFIPQLPSGVQRSLENLKL